MTYAIDHQHDSAAPAHTPPTARSAKETRLCTAFDAQLVTLLPVLRTYARALCANSALADDLVQEASVSAMTHAHSFVPGTNMRAWLFTILRNEFYSLLRKRRREVEDIEGKYTDSLSVNAKQDDVVDLSDTMVALGKISERHRHVLLLVGREGLSYEEAALRGKCAVGTIKSRAHRARVELTHMLS